MPLELAPPPANRARRCNYDELFAALTAAPGEWASLPLDEVGGTTTRDKQRSLHTAAINRGCKVQTTVQQGRVYARIVAAL